MIAEFIGAFSLAALGQVCVSYCRAVLASGEKIELSERVLKVAGMQGPDLAADDFDRFLQLVHLCPEHDSDRTGLRAVSIYYRLLRVLDRLFGRMVPGLAVWSERERESCSHFAAVVLDRCISSSRSLFAQQAGDPL
jgi:hypothetical protein